MLCCAIVLALLGVPTIALKAFLKPVSRDPLAWRLAPAPQSDEARQFSSILLLPFLKTRARSFAFAGAGIWYVATREQSSVIHGLATIAAIACGWALGLTLSDWRWIVVSLFAVWSAEAFNTAVESTCNLLSPQFDEHVRIAKDAAAGAVLLVSCGAAIVGLMTFWPYLNSLPTDTLLTLCSGSP